MKGSGEGPGGGGGGGNGGWGGRLQAAGRVRAGGLSATSLQGQHVPKDPNEELLDVGPCSEKPPIIV